MKRGVVSATVPGGIADQKTMVSTGTALPTTGQSIVTKPEHAVYYAGKPCWSQETMAPAPNSGALSSTSYFSFMLENSSSGVIHDSTLRFEIDFTTADTKQPSDSRVLPVTQWFERIEWYDRFTGQEIVRYHGDMLHMLLNTLSQEALEPIADMMNLDRKTGKYSQRRWKKDDKHYFYFHLTHNWWDGMDIDLGALRGDLEIRFYPRGSIFVTDQTTVAVPCTAVLREIRHIVASTKDALDQRVKGGARSRALQQNYIDFQQYVDYGRVLNADEEFGVDLDQFHHDSGALIMLLRKSGWQSSSKGDGLTYDPNRGEGLFRFESLGDKAVLDYENVHGKSLMGEGTPFDALYFQRQVLPDLFNYDYCKHNNVYVIPFSKDLKGMLNGEIDGFQRFCGDRERIRFRTAPPPVHNLAVFSIPKLGTLTQLKPWEFTDMKAHITFSYDGHYLADFDLMTGTNAFAKVDNGLQSYQYNVQATDLWKKVQEVLNATEYLVKNDMMLKLSGSSALGGTGVTGAEGWDAANDGLIHVSFTNRTGQPLLDLDTADVGKLKIRVYDTNRSDTNYDYVLKSWMPGETGFNSGIYDITIYSVYYRFLHESNGNIHVQAV